MADEITETSQTVAAGQLRALIERIERLEEEKKTIADDIKDVYAERRATASTPRRCAPSYACASRTRPSAKRPKRSSISTKPLWA